MKQAQGKSLRRSVSPFGLKLQEPGPFQELEDSLQRLLPPFKTTGAPSLHLFPDVQFTPAFFNRALESPANDCPDLETLCQFLIRYAIQIEETGLFDVVFRSMELLFNQKTELFLVDHQNEEHCKKVGLDVPYRDIVLFSRERNLLIGGYFAPMTNNNPGHFSEFINRWVQSDSMDRALHFLDFCRAAHDSSSEHYLLFTHPALGRIIRNKPQLQTLLELGRPLLKKLASPTWEKDVRASLGL